MKMNKRIISILTVILALAIVVSCTYDEKDQLDGKGVRRIRMQIAAGDYGYNSTVVAFALAKQTRAILTINRDAISAADLQTSTSVDVAILDSTTAQLKADVIATNAVILQSYIDADSDNRKGGDTLFTAGKDPVDSFYHLDPKFFSLESGTVSFGPGDAVKEVMLVMDPTLGFDLSRKFVIGVQLSNPQAPYTLSASLNYAVVQIVVKNAYDGVYHIVGNRFNYNSAGGVTGWDDKAFPEPTGFVSTIPILFDYGVATVDASTVTYHAAQLDGGFGTINLHVNSDNTVDVSPNSTTQVTNVAEIPGHKSKYDPAKGTFHIVYEYTNVTGSYRILVETAVYKGSR